MLPMYVVSHVYVRLYLPGIRQSTIIYSSNNTLRKPPTLYQATRTSAYKRCFHREDSVRHSKQSLRPSNLNALHVCVLCHADNTKLVIIYYYRFTVQRALDDMRYKERSNYVLKAC